MADNLPAEYVLKMLAALDIRVDKMINRHRISRAETNSDDILSLYNYSIYTTVVRGENLYVIERIPVQKLYGVTVVMARLGADRPASYLFHTGDAAYYLVES